MGIKDWDNDDQPAREVDLDWKSIVGDFDTIPVIDVGGIRSDVLKERQEVARHIEKLALESVSFTSRTMEYHSILLMAFSSMPRNSSLCHWRKKLEIYIENSPNFKGYTPVGASGKPGPDGKGNLRACRQA
ncbi:hypothetical protein LTR10_017572 [Elasticomyces elasticus]|uniref:Uncharacterized protein n=1 Tax=Exophiala sideris TaxID=1016849 RepID=A0ABR0IZK4_9EURO|nr:hypothetical protein LTR10_017572 [Elasticomyces elasticus]KAK5023421.1 hypothetical protein LTS07_009296 [Exophiala sideris]KAK5028204.1 hypothetical protein LTR13_009192 [Exophiala sideris]KAK5052862.1 hypothetical protein LTR69_009688 [Exophiala sideris]KAK5178473.1 hypothetical protein LTR44_009098 [Eurotiomycetes sp. CCFEE 6388]